MSRSVPQPLAAGTAAFAWPRARREEFDQLAWRGLVYSCEPGYRPLFLDLHVPRSTPAPLVVWLHGGGWTQGSRVRISPNVDRHWLLGRMLLAGLAVALVDYRLASEAPFPAAVDDVRAAVRWLRAHAEDFGLDASRVAVFGQSAGAHLACLATSLDDALEVRAIVDWFGPTDLAALGELGEDAIRGSDWDAPQASPLAHVRAGLPPLFVAHGRDDLLVPVAQSRTYVEALRAAGVEVEYLETDGDHVFEGAPVLGEVVERTLDFLRRHLDVDAPTAVPPDPGATDAALVLQRAVPTDVVLERVEGLAADCALRCRHPGTAVEVLFLIAPRRSPVQVDGLPAIVGVGALDPRLDETLSYVYALREADVPVTLRVFPTLGEGFFGSHGSRAAERASEQLCRDLNELIWDA